MDAPQVEEIQISKRIGKGGCGSVYAATDDHGAQLAIKIFDSLAISKALLEKMTKRLASGGWPAGVMPVVFSESAEGQFRGVMPLLATVADGAQPVPRNLQKNLDEHPGHDSWKIVRALVRVLAVMHERRVPHGNLKPENVYFGENGDLILSDWTLGNMPGIAQFNFTDAVLYQPPEQLRNPSGYLDEEGYQWDVFSFGVLAFRILTGVFPRCQQAFSVVAPAAGESCKKGIQADLKKVARNLENQQAIAWPDEAKTPLESDLREWISRCLELDTLERPRDMIEVSAGFVVAENRRSLAAERESQIEQQHRTGLRVWQLVCFAAGCMVLGGLWTLFLMPGEKNHVAHAHEIRLLTAANEAALKEKADADKSMTTAQQSLAYERELARTQLEGSRQIGDRLFAWAMETDNRRLPPLDGRELRLKHLERYFTDFLTRTVNQNGLAAERAMVRLELAEISLAAGKAPVATKRITEAMDAWSSLPMDDQLKFRMAMDSLRLALLRQSIADPETANAFVVARNALETLPQPNVDQDRLNQLLAILDFHEAKLFDSKGNDTQALKQLMRATQTLNRIADQRPDLAILRSELADCYLSSATLLEGMGSLGDAHEVRSLATVQLTNLLKKSPEDCSLKLNLAGCYGAMAESSILSGDVTGAESSSKQATILLDQILAVQPGNADAIVRKAAQLGLMAGIHRDRGQAAEAMEGFGSGIHMLEAVRVSSPENSIVAYRLAVLWWQKGRMIGISGNHEDEIALILKGRELLTTLEADASLDGPRPEQLQSTSAYLLGDLGHALQLDNQKVEAAKAFNDAAHLWQGLVASRPRSEEYSEGLAWCHRRLDDLK